MSDPERSLVHLRPRAVAAAADLGEDSRDVGMGDTPQDAVQEALRSLAEPYASEMAAGVGRWKPGGEPQ